MSVPIEANRGGIVIEYPAAGQVFYATDNETPAVTVVNLIDVRNRKGRFDINGERFSAGLGKLVRTGKIGDYSVFAVESGTPLMGGSDQDQHPAVDIEGKKITPLPITESQLAEDEYYTVRYRSKQGRAVATIGRYMGRDAQSTNLLFGGWDDRLELPTTFSLDSRLIGRDPRLAGVATIYPVVTTIRKVLSAGGIPI